MTVPLHPVPPPLPAEAAVLLVLLPAEELASRLRAGTLAALASVQQQLGPAVRVLTVDKASNPSVVRSFHATDLPAFVLMRHGTELWRRQGLPEGEITAAWLLRQLETVPAAALV